MTRNAVDVLVVGAGPAGCAAALAAHRAGLSVLVRDAAAFPRDKVCGDGVAPHALDVLAGLGVDPADLVAGSTPVATLRLRSPAGVVAARPMPRPGWVVPRQVFDARLVAAVRRAGIEMEHRRVRRVIADEHGVDVDGLRAAVVVGADGAESRVRRATDVRPAPPGTTAVAIRGYAADVGPVGEQLLVMSREHWPSYAWAFPVGDGCSNVGYGRLLRGPAPTRRDLVEGLRTAFPGVRPERVRGHRLPLSTGRPRPPDGRVLLAGDAAGLINPLTGEGIFYAVLSGSLAGRAAASGHDAGRSYRRSLSAALGGHLRHTDVLARACRRPWFLDAGVRAARDRAQVFDTVCELGLGAGRLDLRTAVSVGHAALTVRS